jgi:hypothetical protein
MTTWWMSCWTQQRQAGTPWSVRGSVSVTLPGSSWLDQVQTTEGRGGQGQGRRTALHGLPGIAAVNEKHDLMMFELCFNCCMEARVHSLGLLQLLD